MYKLSIQLFQNKSPHRVIDCVLNCIVSKKIILKSDARISRFTANKTWSVPVYVVGGVERKLEIQHVTYRHCVQTPGTCICAAQYVVSATFEVGVLAGPCVHRHSAVQVNRVYVTVVQEHIDPIASVIAVAEYDYRLFFSCLWLDILQ